MSKQKNTLTRTILDSIAYQKMREFNIKGTDLINESVRYELYHNAEAGISPAGLDKIKKGLHVKKSTYIKFLNALNSLLKKKGIDKVYSLEEIGFVEKI